MMKSTSYVLCLSCFILMIIYLEFKYGLNYIPSKQPKYKAGILLKDNSNQDNSLQEQDLRRWMNEKEHNYQKDKERIQQICQKYNVKSRKLIEKQWIPVDRNHGIAVCAHAKVGTSTWIYHIWIHGNLDEKVKAFTYPKEFSQS